MAVSILLAIILPASLIAGSFATADTAANEPSAADTAAPAALGGTGGGGRQTPRVAKQNSGISSSKATSLSTPTTPESPLASPSPLATSSPLPTSSPLHSTPGKTGTEDSSHHNLQQTRSNTQYTVTFSNPLGTDTTQTITDGERAIRPADPTKDGYLFDGWFIGNTSVAYDFNQPVTDNLTLTAKWTKGAGTWSISPDHGPETGNTKATITPPTRQDIRFSQIQAGNSHSLAIGSDGNLYSWGSNQNGQLGRNIGSATYDAKPGLVVKPAGASDDFTWVQASAGYDHSLAIGSDGNLYSWGINSFGQLGRSIDSPNDAQPGLVAKPAGTSTIFTWSQISAGGEFSLAIGSNGVLYSWGCNQWGQLGIGIRDSQTHITPSPIKNPSTATITWSKVSAGYDHALAIGSDRSVYSWGGNNHGQLGNGDSSSYWSTTLVKPQLPDTVTITQISAKSDSSLALTSDGTLYAWGWNDNGQIGRGATGSSAFYVNPDKLTVSGVSFTQAGAGRGTTLALGSDGKLYGWGKYGGTPITGTPSQVSFTQVSAGDDYLLVLGSDGNLYSWGNNKYGQLGLTDNVDTSTGIRTPKLTPFPETATLSSVDFGGTAGTNLTANTDGTWSVTTPKHARGKTDVTVSWSMNGQQPDVHLTYRYFGIYNIAFSSDDGSCPAPSGMPKDQSATESEQVKRPYPDPQAAGCLFDGWFVKDANGDSNVAYDFSQPVTKNVALVAHWSLADTRGWSINPDKGNVLGGQQVTITHPKTSRGVRFNQISAGGSKNREMRGFSVGVASDGNAYAWGNNNYGQLGTGDNKQQDRPTEVLKPEGVKEGFTYTQISSAGAHTLAIGSNGILYSWGRNDFGQLGNGSTDTSVHAKPEAVINPSTGQPFQAVQVSAGACDSVAIDTTGKVYSWGSETTTLGDSVSTANSVAKTKPTLVADPGGTDQGLHAVRVSANWSFIMALNADGNIYAWGYNNWGQFGNGSSTNSTWTTYSSTPTLVRDPTDTSKGLQATRISAGAWHALAIGQDGTVWAWGMDNNGQLGFSTDYQTLPKQVPNLKAQQVSASTWNSLAIGQDGTAWGWGNNANGQLGDGTTSKRTTPRPVSSPADQSGSGTGFASVRISAGWGHSVAIGQDGKAYAWGDNRYNQLGAEQSLTQSRTPTLVAFNPTLLITGVKFDKTVVNPLQQNSDGSVSFATPVHNPGQADVVVDWTLDGVSQTQEHLAYTYEGVLPLTGGNGSMILLLAAGLLATAGAVAAGRHRRETHALHA
ncbi:RCC1 repeat domain protein, 2 domains [Bifidobacterium polysaccharolyticum]|nr:RCC1 repeat domain protein, 2 domains [Bifidobacterium asteroides]